MRNFAIGVYICMLVACGSPSLSATDLEPLLIQPGDLPAGLSGAQIRDTPPAMFAGYPTATKTIDQRFQRNGGDTGGVAVLLYDSSGDVAKAYAMATKDMTSLAQPLDGIGEHATGIEVPGIGADLAFTRCHAFVHIRLGGAYDQDDATAYAKRLDSRLSHVIC